LKSGAFIYSTIRKFPEQFLIGYRSALETDLSSFRGKAFRRILFAGMGGSSLPGDLINDTLSDSRPLRPIRNYRIPSDVGPDDLVIASSYSGNTEETIEALQNGLQKKAATLVLSHGGKLAEMALEKKIPLLRIPECIQPRCATGYFFGSLLALLEILGKTPPARQRLEKLQVFLEKEQERHEERGKSLAKSLNARVPLIYGPSELEGACRIWKIKFNENAKTQSFYNVFPELNHNEMVGFTHLDMNPSLILLKSQFMHPRVVTRMEVMESILGDKIPFHTLTLKGEDLLQEMFDSLAVADYASFYLAEEYGIDPAPVAMVEDFKKKL